MLELKFSLKDSLKVKQLQYILTEDVDYCDNRYRKT
jgi:hypothetical protein